MLIKEEVEEIFMMGEVVAVTSQFEFTESVSTAAAATAIARDPDDDKGLLLFSC